MTSMKQLIYLHISSTGGSAHRQPKNTQWAVILVYDCVYFQKWVRFAIKICYVICELEAHRMLSN